jgi:hypothetical protein
MWGEVCPNQLESEFSSSVEILENHWDSGSRYIGQVKVK